MSNRNLVMASTSPHRRALLERIGLGSVVCVAPRCDEEVDDPTLSPAELVQLLAERKARSVASAFPEDLIIGADQVVELDGQVLGKPGTEALAVEQLLSLAGREHRLVTGVCVHEPHTGRSELGVDVHRMRMWPHDRGLLERYVARERPLDCAGAYKVESAGAALFESMAGEDFTAIVGLPLCQVGKLLATFDLTLLDLVLRGRCRVE